MPQTQPVREGTCSHGNTSALKARRKIPGTLSGSAPGDAIAAYRSALRLTANLSSNSDGSVSSPWACVPLRGSHTPCSQRPPSYWRRVRHKALSSKVEPATSMPARRVRYACASGKVFAEVSTARDLLELAHLPQLWLGASGSNACLNLEAMQVKSMRARATMSAITR